MPSHRTEPGQWAVTGIEEEGRSVDEVDLFEGFDLDPDEFDDPRLVPPEEIAYVLWRAGMTLEQWRAASGVSAARKRGRPRKYEPENHRSVQTRLYVPGEPIGSGLQRRELINRQSPHLMALLREIGFDRSRSMLVELTELNLDVAISKDMLTPFVPRALRKHRHCQIVFDIGIP